MQEPYKLKADEEWPEEVAHLFGNKREGEEEAEGKSIILVTIETCDFRTKIQNI